MSKRKMCQECSCWMSYPNKNHASKSKCKCDNYVCINQVVHPYKKKTHCIRKDVIFGFTKEGEEKSYAMGYQDGCEDGLQGIRPQGEWGKWIITEIQCPTCFGYFETDCYSKEELKKCPNCKSDMRKGGADL